MVATTTTTAPKSAAEFRLVQSYFAEAAEKDASIGFGHTYTLNGEKPHKVAIRGLGPHTRAIPSRKGRNHGLYGVD